MRPAEAPNQLGRFRPSPAGALFISKTLVAGPRLCLVLYSGYAEAPQQPGAPRIAEPKTLAPL